MLRFKNVSVQHLLFSMFEKNKLIRGGGGGGPGISDRRGPNDRCTEELKKLKETCLFHRRIRSHYENNDMETSKRHSLLSLIFLIFILVDLTSKAGLKPLKVEN